MKLIHLIILLSFTIYSIKSIKKQIYLQQTKQIQIQVDQIYQQTIPQFFDMYQATQFVNFTKNQLQQNYKEPICQIQQIKDSQYTSSNVFYHYKLADPQRYFLGRKKIFNFNDLSKVTGIIDVIQFQSKIISLFQNGFYSQYDINTQSGIIESKQVKLLGDSTQNIHQNNYGAQVYKSVVNYGNLIKSQQNEEFLVFFGEDQVLLMNSTSKIFEQVIGYEPIGISFQKAIIVGTKIYVATGQKGVYVYEISFKKKAIKLQQQFKPYVMYKYIEARLQVTDIEWDPINNQLIVIDDKQGIHWVTIPQITQSSVECSKSSILLERCSNIRIIVEQKVAISTCPQLLIINLVTKNHTLIDEIQFNPETVLINQSRILIFGEYRYAVYDLTTDLVQTGQSTVKIDFAEIKDHWIVIVNTLSISTGLIHPGLQKLKCFVESQSSAFLLGKSTANISIEGICSQLFPLPLLSQENQHSIFFPTPEQMAKITFNHNQKQNCELIYNIKFDIQNSQIVSYLWQVIAGAVILWILCSGLIVYCVKDIKVKKQYESLQQQLSARGTNVQEKTKNQLFEQK